MFGYPVWSLQAFGALGRRLAGWPEAGVLQ